MTVVIKIQCVYCGACGVIPASNDEDCNWCRNCVDKAESESNKDSE